MEYSLGFVDNDSSFSILFDIKCGSKEEWADLAKYITEQIHLVAGGQAVLEAYDEHYDVDRDIYLYKYGHYPTIVLVERTGSVYRLLDDDTEYKNPLYWSLEQINNFFQDKYNGEKWSLGTSNIPHLVTQSLSY